MSFLISTSLVLAALLIFCTLGNRVQREIFIPLFFFLQPLKEQKTELKKKKKQEKKKRKERKVDLDLAIVLSITDHYFSY